jgi:probable Rubsico expression protein CbbX
MIPPKDMDRILSFGSKQARKRAQRRAQRGDPDHNLLPPEASIALAAEREATGIDGILAALEDDLIGLAPIKQKVNEIASLLLVDRARRRFGLDAQRPNLHMCFTGSPGTGKTTVALRMASLLKQMGYLEQGQLVHAMRNDLIGEFIGQTAPRTKRVLDKAMGGVLFIDEAYYLYNKHDPNDFGQEAVGILLQVMENDRDKLVVILAGYKDRMDEFFSSNPGMSSRIAHHLDFVDYELGELLSIGEVMLSQSNYYLSPDAEAVLKQQLSRQMDDPRFSNARSVRNDLDRARLRHAFRLSAEPDRLWGRDDLMRLEPSDVLDDEPG